jgi:hypothetical protein
LNPLAGVASVSRAPNFADVFVVDAQFHLRTAYSSMPPDWKGPVPFSDPAFELHPMSRPAVVSRALDHLDVFVVGHYAGQDQQWQVYTLFWSQSDGWSHIVAGKTVYHVQPLFDGQFRPHPAAGLAAVSCDATPLEVFAVSLEDGQLYRAAWNGKAWSSWALVTAPPYRTAGGPGRIASIEAIVRRGGDDLEIVVTGRDGNLYAVNRPGTGAFGGYVTFPTFTLH